MFKTFVTAALTFLFLFTSFNSEVMAATKKKRSKKTTDGKFVSRKKSGKKYAKNPKSRRHRGSSVDLKALTTESPYTENTDNGVNPVETKPGIQ
ncbi:MAG: hypothetical protein H7177_13135 [Rhizobacter sp.]|nr:hypothetical protein [Bacteriovorax sp.]